ncbi:cell wall-binding repeat-containing protein [Desulfosporosinus shakirovi]|uniref:cell wall-binding repeat-containing protein n=1 Tax=Desulfosporosinus shakirovi TaxID=2885154 RepID=UPI001E646B2F|nr:cell wall-binding repeat-containing protein [Desulfosporosinus sp. SRJS8]MCB8816711.1 cell wall-binding repeat-containing protein [Desulfosporosinus sp. SRJS8]
MERKRKNVTTLSRSLAFVMTLIMAFYMSFACEMNALATDYGDKNLQGSDQTVTITFDPQGGVFKDDGTTETRETIFFTVSDDNDNHYYKVIKDADIPELEERLGYAFEGWYFNEQKLEDGDCIFADVAFDAQWSVMDSNTDAGTGTDSDIDTEIGPDSDVDNETGTDSDVGTDTGTDSDTEIPSEDTNSEEENLEDTEATQLGEEITVAFDPQGGVFKDDGTGETRETIFFADRTDNDNQYYGIFTAADIPLLEERPGYVFEGWYSEGTKLEEGSHIFAGMTFEAQWSEAVAANLLAAVSSGAKEFGEKEFTVPGESVTLFFDPKGGTFANNGTTETRELAFPAQELNEENYYYSIISAEDIPELEERPGYTFEGWYFEGEKLEGGDHIYGELVQFNAKWKGGNTATVNENVEGLFGGTLPVIEFGGAGQAAQLAVQALAEPKSAEALAADAAALSIAELDVDSAVQLDIDLVSGSIGSYGVVITMPIPTALADADQIAAIHYGQTTEAIRCEISEETDTLSFTLESFSPVILVAGEAPEYATVYIENVKGGVLAVFNSKDVKLLPVGENVQVAIGDTLYMLAYPMEDGKGTIESVATEAETTGGRSIPLVGPFDGTYTLAVTQDTILTTTFERVAADDDNSLSVQPNQEGFPVAAGETGTSINTTLTASRNGKVLSGAVFTKSEEDSDFEFTVTEEGVLTSEAEVEMGCYTVYVDVTNGGETYEELPVSINSGSSVTIEQYLANNVRSDLLNMCFDKSLAYAQGTRMETVLNNGYAAFPMYNYDTFAGVHTADGTKVSGSDDPIPQAENHYFMRHANNEGELYSLTVRSLPGGGSSGAKEFGEKEFTVPGESVTLFFDPKGGTFANNGTTETREIAFPAQELNEENYYYSIISAEDIPELANRPGYTFEGWYFEGEKLEAGDHIYGELVQFDAKWKGTNTAAVDENVRGLFGGTLPLIKFGGAGQMAQLSVRALTDQKSTETLAADAVALNITSPDVDSAVQLDIDLVSGTVGSYGVVITMPIPTALADAEEITAIHYGQTTEAIRCEVSEDTDTLSFTLESFSPVVLLAGKAPEYATVYIENVKGGALAVFNSKDVKLLPVGENVQIAIGDTLYMLAYPMEDGKGTIESVGTKAETTGGRPIPLVGPFDGTYTLAVTQDTILTATFKRVAENHEDSLSVKPAQEDFLVASGESGTSISTTLRAYREGKALTGATFTKSEEESGFEFTLTEGGGLTSDGEVELGCYTVYVDLTYGGETYEELPVVINSGSSVTIEQYVANNVRSDLLNMCFDKSLAYAQGTGMETVLNNGYAAFPMYNYDTFAGVYTANGRKVSGSDAAVPLAKNHYFLRHANNEGELYSLTVPSLPGGSSDNDDNDDGDNDSDNGSSGGSGSSSADKYVSDSSIVEKADGVKVTLTRSSSKISSAQLKKLIAKNEDKPIVFNGPDYTITFAKGSMQTSAGQTSIDFSLKIGVDADSLNLPEADADNLALVLSFKHSGALPGEAAITVKAGSRYAGQTLHYYYYNESTDQLEFRQSVSVDSQGFVTVNQDHCSDYVLLTQKLTVKEVGLERTYGESRYDTAVEIAKAYFSDGADTVILARGDVSADALPAVPLAKKLNAPILLTPPDNLPDNVLAQIQALGTKKVIITGGTGAVKTAVSERLEAQGISVERIYGTTQYETAYEIAKALNSAGGRAVLVNGNSGQGSFADALSIAPWAGYQGVPILYAGGEGEMLPEATARAFSELGINQTLLIGGTAVLPQSLESLVPNAQRYDGIDRYATNVRVLENLQPNPQAIYVVSGRDFADALSAAAVAAQNNAWLLLAGYEGEGGSNGLTREQEVLLQSAKENVEEIRVFGGIVAVPQSTLEAIEALLGQ